MRYYVIAGERSGDLHGGNLLRALRKNDPQAIFKGFGGDQMEAAGCEITLHYKNMAFMGFWEVLKNLGKVKRYLKLCRKDALEFKPDVAILIDFAGFNLRMAKFLKENNIRTCYYISPKIWAWGQGRAKKIKKYVDQMLVILPFEKEFYKKYDWDVDYVGNPVCDAVQAHTTNTKFLTSHGLKEDEQPVALLPGSRTQEIRKITPLFKEVAARFPRYRFMLAAVRSVPVSAYDGLGDVNNIELVFEETYDLLAHARAAIVASGTATLETALWKTPQLVVYKTSYVSYMIARMLIKVPYISLVNLVLDRPLVKELIQGEMTVGAVSEELQKLMRDGERRREVTEGHEELARLLGDGNASEQAAERTIEGLSKKTD